jgi:hypothetical protein
MMACSGQHATGNNIAVPLSFANVWQSMCLDNLPTLLRAPAASPTLGNAHLTLVGTDALPAACRIVNLACNQGCRSFQYWCQLPSPWLMLLCITHHCSRMAQVTTGLVSVPTAWSWVVIALVIFIVSAAYGEVVPCLVSLPAAGLPDQTVSLLFNSPDVGTPSLVCLR